MYAAIDEQDKVYTSGSETYAQIQPTMTEVQGVQNEQTLFSRVPSRSDETYSAPQPPSVDSLRHVAHAHSRQGKPSIIIVDNPPFCYILFFVLMRAHFSFLQIVILQLRRPVPTVPS